MRYINILIPCLFIGFVTQINGYTWKVTNGTDEDLTIRVNASGQKMERFISKSGTGVFSFDGWKSGLCFTNMAVKRGKKWHTIKPAPEHKKALISQSILTVLSFGAGAVTFLPNICKSSSIIVVKDAQGDLYFQGFE